MSLVYTEPAALADQIMQEASPPPRPDLWTRLVTQEGYDRAASIWSKACHYIDASARHAALTDLKAALTAEPRDLAKAVDAAYAVMQLSHYRLAAHWEQILETLGDAAKGGRAPDFQLLLEDIDEADKLEDGPF